MPFDNPELAVGAIAGGILLTAFLMVVAVYVYSALAIMTLAKKTNTPNAWLAWIPLANLFLVANIAGIHWWTALVVLLASWIPLIGQLAALAIIVWWFWKISEKRNFAGPLALLMIVPLANLIYVGVLAWHKD